MPALSCCVCKRNNEWPSLRIETVEHQEADWLCMAIACPECNELIVRTARCFGDYTSGYTQYDQHDIYPNLPRHIPVNISSDAPDNLRSDYIEASSVLPVSAKASAALSRRTLQSILRDQGYQSRNLADQINTVLEENDPDKLLPLALRNNIDAIRNFGNFSAHPITDITSLQIIDVQPEEAEWCLEIIEGLFEHYYVRPAIDAKKLVDLNQKLNQAGQPPTKS